MNTQIKLQVLDRPLTGIHANKQIKKSKYRKKNENSLGPLETEDSYNKLQFELAELISLQDLLCSAVQVHLT